MRQQGPIDPTKSQFRWVVLLLCLAVALPIGCVLWFMGQAVSNVRSAAQQQQTEDVSRAVAHLKDQANQAWLERANLEAQVDALSDADLFGSLLTKGQTQTCFSGGLIYGPEGNLRFPVLPLAERHSSDNEPQMFRVAWRLEYTSSDPVAAAQEYRRAARSTTDPGVRLRALWGAIRCERKAGRMDEALVLTEELLSQSLSIQDADLARLITQIRIQYAEAYADQPERQAEILEQLLVRLLSYNQEQALLPARTRIALLKKVLELVEASPSDRLAQRLEAAHAAIETETLCLQQAERYPSMTELGRWPESTVRLLDPNQPLYGFQIEAREKTLLVLMQERALVQCLEQWIVDLVPELIGCRLVREGQQLWSRYPQDDRPVLMTVPLCDYLPGWNLEIETPREDALEQRVRQKVTTYLRIGALVISAMALLGIFMTVTLRKQARVHRLKNDFIATVTHELKTPLASMRLLVDTLLEGRYHDSEQVNTYLQLVAKENIRLTGLIDNFLTFSRMERNKHNFTITSVPAATIVEDAAEAMRAKLTSNGFDFTVDVAADLPPVMADHDAIVTVLVNLMDNACKYSGERKVIALKAEAKGNGVIFTVADQGLGIPRRALKRIFRKFFQVDRRLAGNAKGCGLGLSIVKFIVQAHQGQIRVDSKVGAGSTFMIELPIAK